jgi:hypothetical protein
MPAYDIVPHGYLCHTFTWHMASCCLYVIQHMWSRAKVKMLKINQNLCKLVEM